MLKIALAMNGRAGNGFVASIEDDDSGTIYLTDEPAETSARRACSEAARKLREAADRFEALAKKQNPEKITVQETVNRMKPILRVRPEAG
jgi:hypothetical protein